MHSLINLVILHIQIDRQIILTKSDWLIIKCSPCITKFRDTLLKKMCSIDLDICLPKCTISTVLFALCFINHCVSFYEKTHVPALFRTTYYARRVPWCKTNTTVCFVFCVCAFLCMPCPRFRILRFGISHLCVGLEFNWGKWPDSSSNFISNRYTMHIA